MMRAKHKVWQNALVIVALSCTGGASEAADPLLSSIVGIYDGEIESNTMVQISTEFYFDAPSSGGGLTSQGTSSSVEIVGVFGAAGKAKKKSSSQISSASGGTGTELVGRYRYQDGAGWDNGVVFNIRVDENCRGTVGGANDNVLTNQGTSSNVEIIGVFGAAGKAKKKSSGQLSSARGGSGAELCITGIWQDSYGQGPVKLTFSPTRDSFSGYYRSPGDEWAIWDGSDIPKSRRLAETGGTVSSTQAGGAVSSTQGTAQVEQRVVSTKSESNYKQFLEKGVGNTKERAVKEAYFFALEQQITGLVGTQAAGDVGHWFRVRLKQDFDQFRSRYFTPDTTSSCARDASSKHVCSVTGRLKLAAIQNDIRELTKKSERKLTKKLVFFFSSSNAVAAVAEKGTKWQKHAEYLVEKLEGAFIERGHRLITGQAGRQAIADGGVDFGLAVKAIEFHDIKVGSQYTSGALRVNFRLTHIASSRPLASTPITEVHEVPGTIEVVLMEALSNRISEKIALGVTESVLNFQDELDQEEIARKNLDTGQKTYYLRLTGISKKNRKELRVFRKSIKQLFPDSKPATDPDQTDPNQVTIVFSTAQEVDHDDLLDFFYEKYENLPGFDAEHLGNNEYSLYFQISAPKPPPVDPEVEKKKKREAEKKRKAEQKKQMEEAERKRKEAERERKKNSEGGQ